MEPTTNNTTTPTAPVTPQPVASAPIESVPVDNAPKGNTMIIAIVVVTVVLLLGAGLIFYKLSKNNNVASAPVTIPTISQTQSTPTPSVPSSSQSASMVTPGDNSNDALDNDLQKVGANMNNVDSSTTSVDQGLNQQAVDPSQ